MFSWFFSEPLTPGIKAPDFSLPGQDGKAVRLSNLRGKNVVLVFYPADNTSVCTKQLCEFRDQWQQARKRNAEVFGVNPGSAETHRKFQEKYRFPFPLLVDDGQKVAALYHANGLFIKRTVYLIGPDGVILYGKRGKPDPTEVFAAAR
jgi:peroxiredoxin Q/BCP